MFVSYFSQKKKTLLFNAYFPSINSQSNEKKKKKNSLTLHTETRYSLQHPNSHNPACTSTTHHRPYSRLTYRRLPAPLSTNLFNPVRLEEGTNLRTTISFVGRVERRGRGGRTNLFKPNTATVFQPFPPPLFSQRRRPSSRRPSRLDPRSPFVDAHHPPPRQPPATGPENSISGYRQSPSTLCTSSSSSLLPFAPP